jgi:DivIVA domain-containing protein
MGQPPLEPPTPPHQLRLTRCRFRVGYNISQVDEFLRRAHHALESVDGSLNASDAHSARFGLAGRFKEGYDIGEVDDELDRIAAALQGLERPLRV